MLLQHIYSVRQIKRLGQPYSLAKSVMKFSGLYDHSHFAYETRSYVEKNYLIEGLSVNLNDRHSYSKQIKLA